MLQSLLKILIITFTLLSATTVCSNDIESILKDKQAPEGVVFEIVSAEQGILSKLLPTLKQDIIRLRKRFPDIPVAIVTHGTEQFDLTTDNKKTESTAHNLVEELVKSNDVDVHVCGTHAGWFDVMPEDFPDYVNVAPAGPTQINDYQELGYELIVLP